MSNVLYDEARRLWALGDIDWVNDTFYCCLVSAAYSHSVSHIMLSAIDGSVGGARDFGTSGPEGVQMENGGVATNGAIYADPVRFVSVAADRPQVKAIVIYRYAAGVAENSNLIYYADVATGLPIQPNGGDIIVTWSTGTNRILRL